MIFDPINITEDVTPKSIIAAVKQEKFGQALLMSLHLGETKILSEVYRSVPFEEIELVAKSIPSVYINKIMTLVAEELENTGSVELNLKWVLALLSSHSDRLQKHAPQYIASFRALQKAIAKQQKTLGLMCRENLNTLMVLSFDEAPSIQSAEWIR